MQIFERSKSTTLHLFRTTYFDKQAHCPYRSLFLERLRTGRSPPHEVHRDGF
jgi:hypothetical protein